MKKWNYSEMSKKVKKFGGPTNFSILLGLEGIITTLVAWGLGRLYEKHNIKTTNEKDSEQSRRYKK